MTTDLARSTWVEILAPAADLAERISTTDFVPRALRNRPEAVLACILAGHELGIGPMAALSKIHVIDGRPAPAAELMRAVALSAGHTIWVEESTTTRVTMCGRRNGDDHTFKCSWTLDDAKRAGLVGKNNWRTYPRAMLLARASAELCRLMCPEVLAGLSYAAEEVQDMDTDFNNNGYTPSEPAITEPATVTRKARKVSKRPALVAATSSSEPEPPPAPPLPDEQEPEPTPEPQSAKKELSKAQKVAIAARDVDVDHHDIVEIVTNGATRSANALNDNQLAEVSDTIRRIKLGELVLVNDEAGRRLIDATETGPMTADQISRLRALLDQAGVDRRTWVETELGRPIDGWGDISSEEGAWLIGRATNPTDGDEL